MKTILNESLSSKPIAIPDDADLEQLQLTRQKIAREIEAIETLNKAKESTDFQKIILDSYQSMQMIERAAIMLDPNKANFAITFAGLQGRWRERNSLTREMLYGKSQCRQQKTLLSQITDRLNALKARLKSLKKNQG